MPKTIRESKTLEQVRRWRAEAFEALRKLPESARNERAREHARRLGLPFGKNAIEVLQDRLKTSESRKP